MDLSILIYVPMIQNLMETRVKLCTLQSREQHAKRLSNEGQLVIHN